jgi:hypothetical protein
LTSFSQPLKYYYFEKQDRIHPKDEELFFGNGEM